MLKPPAPKDETVRLCALQNLKVLDTLPEERFDRITRLATRLFDVPIALVSLVDADRQWFKSRQGLAAPETSREISFCGHAILGPAAFVVPDAQADARFRDNPLVTGDPHIRFYAGYPVHSPDAKRVGTLCLIDRKPRSLSGEDVDSLKTLAEMVDHELALLAQSTSDELTNIANRRGFHLITEHILALCRRNVQPATIISIDLDNFKAVNDSFGHDAGDAALCEFAGLLVKAFRDSDIVARLGGDEFCVLSSYTSAANTDVALSRLDTSFRASALLQQYPFFS
jgi:diguanylate cyclase (GGDEF)-like protein